MKLIPKERLRCEARAFCFIPGSYSITFAECFVLNNDRTFFCIECCLLLNISIKTLAAQDNHSSFTFWLSRQFPLVKFLVKAFYFNREITVQSNTALTICALIFRLRQPEMQNRLQLSVLPELVPVLVPFLRTCCESYQANSKCKN